MRVFFLCCLLLSFCGGRLHAQHVGINEVRELFYSCTLDSRHTDSLLVLLGEVSEPSAIYSAYMGATQAIHTKNIWNPFAKIAHVKKALAAINLAVESDPDNIEIRFLRFAVEFHVPAWLMADQHGEADAAFLYAKLRSCDLSHFGIEILRYIRQFYVDNTIYTQEETAEVTGKLDEYIVALERGEG